MATSRSIRFPSEQTGLSRPLPCAIPHIDGVGLDMQRRGGHACSPQGGDLFDGVSPTPGQVFFLLMNVAAQSQNPLHLLALAQDEFRSGAHRIAGVSGKEPLAPALQEIMLRMRQRLDAAASVFYVTALLAVYEAASSRLTYISAGAQPMQLKKGATVTVVDGKGAPLGLPASPAPLSNDPVQAHTLKPGECALFLTPGLVHARSPRGDFGMTRASRVLSAQVTSDPQELCRALVAAAIHFEQQPSRFGPPLKIAGFRETEEEDMTAVALVRPA